MLVVSESVAKKVVDIADAIAAVEACYLALHRGAARLLPVVLGGSLDPQNRFGAKAGVDLSRAAPGLKIGTYWPKNRSRGLASHGSTTLLLDDATGYPRALVSASYLTQLRTAAADAIAVNRLARRSASRLGVIGTGHQAMHELRAVATVRHLDAVRVWSRSESSVAAFVAAARAEGIPAQASPLEALVRESDLLVTVTPARAPVFPADWVAPGTHISAMGADGSGKQELDPALFARARLFADVVAQSITIGEFEAAHVQGLLQPESIVSIGAVLAGEAPGRCSEEDITIFDSSGMALQDIAIALTALERAEQQKLAQTVDLA